MAATPTPAQAPTLGLKDAAEIIVGSCVLAFPVAVTEEVWDLGTALPVWRVAVISLLSIAVIAGFTHYVYHRGLDHSARSVFFKRVAAVYLLTLVVCAVLLTVVDKAPWFTDSLVAIKRTMLVAFPASFSATVVDSLS